MHNVLYVMSTSIKICRSGRHKLSRVLLFILNSSFEPRVVQVFIQFIFRVRYGILSLPGWNPGPWGWVSNVLSLRCTCSPTCQDLGYLWSPRGASVQPISQVLRLFSWPKVCRKLSHVWTLRQKKKKMALLSHLPSDPLFFSLKGRIHYDEVNTLGKGKFMESQGHPTCAQLPMQWL